MASVSANRPTEIKCEKCGETVKVERRGRIPTRCKKCRAEEELERKAKHVVVCVICSADFKSRYKTTKTCSDACERKHASNVRKVGSFFPCKNCGKQIWRTPCQQQPNKVYFCNNKCHGEYKNAIAKTFTCEQCGIVCRIKPGGKNAHRYCSRKCAAVVNAARRKQKYIAIDRELFEWFDDWEHQRIIFSNAIARKIDQAKRAEQKKRPCAVCGKPTTNKKYCSKLCATNTQYIPNGVSLTCNRCGVEYVGRPKSKYGYCPKCRKRMCAKISRRCRLAGVPFERGITLDKVIERDKCRCQICKHKTLLVYTTDANGFVDPRSPTIDHIIPINAKQSERPGHVWSNVQLACFLCNSKKLDNAAGQLRMPF